MNISIVVGNPKPEPRTLIIARAIAQRISSHLGAEVGLEVDLAEFSSKLFTCPDKELATLSSSIAESDILVVASPAHTGILKAFLDRYPNNGLAGVTAVPVMTASSTLHGISIEQGLRPLLAELGASVPTRGLFFLTSQMDSMEDVIDAWAAANLQTGGIFAPMASTRPSESRLPDHNAIISHPTLGRLICTKGDGALRSLVALREQINLCRSFDHSPSLCIA